jgi:hypothetical protein
MEKGVLKTKQRQIGERDSLIGKKEIQRRREWEKVKIKTGRSSKHQS